jgi:hypothetical protein
MAISRSAKDLPVTPPIIGRMGCDTGTFMPR